MIMASAICTNIELNVKCGIGDRHGIVDSCTCIN